MLSSQLKKKQYKISLEIYPRTAIKAGLVAFVGTATEAPISFWRRLLSVCNSLLKNKGFINILSFILTYHGSI